MAEKGFSPFVAICFTINYVVGTGFLTLPWAFQTGGIMLSTLTLALVIIISNMSKNYVLTSMAIAEEIAERDLNPNELLLNRKEEEPLNGYPDRADKNYQTVFREVSVDVELKSSALEEGRGPLTAFAISKKGESESYSSESEGTSEGKLVVKSRKFEITTLCRIFLGNIGEKTYIISIGLDIYGCLWGFTSVFASSIAEMLPITGLFDRDYGIYTAAYALIVVPLSCLELKEQVIFQVLYSACRFLVIFLMIITSFVALGDSKGGGMSEPVHFYDMNGPEGAKMFQFSGFYKMFSVLVFTTIFHAAIPVLSQPVADRKKLSQIFLHTMLITGALFWLLAYSVTSFFGDRIEQSANLNWSTYVGGTGHPSDNGSDKWGNVAVWARAISIFVVCFPALNVISAYPLNSIALGNNLMAAVFGKGVHKAEENRLLVICFRLISSLPPLVGALYVTDLGIITAWTGIVALATAIPIPAFLYIGSTRMANKKGIKHCTYYDGFGSSEGWAKIVILVSGFAMLCIMKTLICD